MAYPKPDGRVLAIVVRDAPNNYSDAVTVDVELDRQELGLPPGALVSLQLETLGRGELGVVEGDVLNVPVEADDFAAVILQKRE